MAGELSPILAGIPVVASTTERGALYPLPSTNQRVHNLGTGAIERYTGTAWASEFQSLSLTPAWNVLDFASGATINDGATDASASILSALNAAKASSTRKRIYFPGGSYKIGSAFSLDGTYSGITLWGDGGDRSKLLRGFNGTMFALSGCANFEVHDIYVDGNYGTNTGKGFVLTGNCNYPIFDKVQFLGLSDSHIEFGADAGYYAKIIATQHFTGTAQPDFKTIVTTGQDTTATPRMLLGVHSNGYHQIHGAFDTQVVGGLCTRVEIDANCSITTVQGTTWANNGLDITIDGANTIVIGCRMSGAVTLNSTMTGSFIGNIQTQGTFTDNSTAGNVIVHHHPLSQKYNIIDKASLVNALAGEIQATTANAVGDADLTYDPNASASTQVYGTTLTANRTVTLATSGVRNGQQVLVSRPAGDTGGPWHITLGTTSTQLLTKKWAVVQYNGSFWRVVMYGDLP